MVVFQLYPMLSSRFRVGLPFSIGLIQKQTHRHARKFSFEVILNPFMLGISIVIISLVGIRLPTLLTGCQKHEMQTKPALYICVVCLFPLIVVTGFNNTFVNTGVFNNEAPFLDGLQIRFLWPSCSDISPTDLIVGGGVKSLMTMDRKAKWLSYHGIARGDS